MSKCEPEFVTVTGNFGRIHRVNTAVRLFALCAISMVVIVMQAKNASADDTGSKPRIGSRSVTFEEIAYRVVDLAAFGTSGERTKMAILYELRKTGFNVVGLEASSFANGKTEEAELVLAGIVSEFNCVGAFKQRCAIRITWEVFDKAEDRVVYKVDTNGLQKEIVSKNSEKKLIAMLTEALHSLINRPKFVELFTARTNDDPVAQNDPENLYPDVAESSAFVDTADLTPIVELKTDADDPDREKKITYKVIKRTGITGTALGAVLVMGTYMATKSAERNHSLTKYDLNRRTTINTIGFVISGVGVGAMIAALVAKNRWELTFETEKQSSAKLEWGFSINSATVNVSF